MAQHDYNIANQTGLEFRADLNSMAEAIVTQNSGPTEPTVTYADMRWLDTSTSPPTEKRRNSSNTGWATTLTEAGRAVAGAADASVQRTALGLGSAATLNAGTSANNVVRLDSSARLPAVDASQLTNLPATGLSAASTAEAWTGTSNTVAITPLRLREGLNALGSAPIYACRAWVNFNGTTSQGTIRASGNVSSVTKNGTGDYTVNFTTAMPDANYMVSGMGKRSGGGGVNVGDPNFSIVLYSDTTQLATSVRIATGIASTGVKEDTAFANVAIFR